MPENLTISSHTVGISQLVQHTWHGQERHAGSGDICCLATETEPQGSQGPCCLWPLGQGAMFPLPPPKELTLSSMQLLERGSRALLYRWPLVNVKGRFTPPTPARQQIPPPPTMPDPVAACRAQAQPHSPYWTRVCSAQTTQHLQLCPRMELPPAIWDRCPLPPPGGKLA